MTPATHEPVLIVDLDDAEAARFLATYDPLAQWADFDSDKLQALLAKVAPALDDNADLRKLISDLSDRFVEQEELELEDHEVPGLALRPHEHYDYLVVLCATSQEWNVICEKLKLVPEKRRSRIGTCRAIYARKLLEVLR